MARHPRLQLLHLGPLGDPVGTAAQARLADLAEAYPGRMVCPREGHYVTGAWERAWAGCRCLRLPPRVGGCVRCARAAAAPPAAPLAGGAKSALVTAGT